VYSKAFEDLENYGVPHTYAPRQLAHLYAVASICYDDGNHKPLITDGLFDRLCRWMCDNYDECVASGADLLDRNLLECCSGHDTRIFVKPYHEIAELFLGHACQCLRCRLEAQERADVSGMTAENTPRGPTSRQRGRSGKSDKGSHQRSTWKRLGRDRAKGQKDQTKPHRKPPKS